MARGESRLAVSTRRSFLKLGAAATAAIAIPQVVPRSVFGATAPSNRIHVGCIGAGNQSTVDLPAFLGHDDVQMMAICDVNTGSDGYKTPKQFLGRKPQQDFINQFYAKKNDAGSYKGCDACVDFREVIGRSDIDAVIVVVPDHWHRIMTVMAAEAGKDIYCEKPLSLTIHDGQLMVEAVRKYKRILQTGSHWRSSTLARRMCELVRNGRVGQIKRVLTYVAANNADSPGPGWKPMPVPEGFDYEKWLGPAPSAPYHKDRCLYRFRFILDYSGGQTTNFGAHSNDLAQWALGTDRSGPVEFEDAGSEWPLPGDLFTAPTKVAFRAKYASGIELLCQTRPESFGIRFEGSEGWIEYGYKGITSEPASLKDSQIGPNEIHLPVSNPQQTQTGSKVFIPDHVRNFLDAIKSRNDPIEPVEAGHRTASLCHLGNIVMKLKRKIKWDPENQQIVGDDEAAKMLRRPIRGPWA